jgi:hypothetical protein
MDPPAGTGMVWSVFRETFCAGRAPYRKEYFVGFARDWSVLALICKDKEV